MKSYPATTKRELCPCGTVPGDLNVQPEGAGKWARVSGDCCGMWEVEFRASYAKDTKLAELADEAWNAAPRATCT